MPPTNPNPQRKRKLDIIDLTGPESFTQPSSASTSRNPSYASSTPTPRVAPPTLSQNGVTAPLAGFGTPPAPTPNFPNVTNREASLPSQSQTPFPQTQVIDDDDWRANERVNATQQIDDELVAFELYGLFETKIVGTRYYAGQATIGETVNVRRDVNNRYDSNAIRIESVMGGQIGHLGRDVAYKFAPFLDSRRIELEGVISGPRGSYDCPITLQIFGSEDPITQAQTIEDMARRGIRIKQPPRRQQRRPDVDRDVGPSGLSQGNRQRKGPRMFTERDQESDDDFDNHDLSMFEDLEVLRNQSATTNPRQIEQVVEKFGISEEDLAKMPMADVPEQLKTNLLPYQRQGLGWMLQKENAKLPEPGSQDVVQLWKRQGNMFTNIATKHSTRDPPPLASGGILADDMGLGKTLQIISLIIANPATRSPNASKTTLIVSPLGVMSNWRDQIAQHIKSNYSLDVLIYHGTKQKRLNTESLRSFDVVITTYGTLVSEYGECEDVLKRGAVPKRGIFSQTWRRVVLDEGHTIRSPDTKGARAAHSLKADSHWSLTGTPIINSLTDLYSQIRFLGLSGGLDNFSVFKNVLIRPLGDKVDYKKEEVYRLLQNVMGAVCLRRKKDMNFINLRLPELSSHILTIKLNETEQTKYTMLAGQARRLFQEYHDASARERGGVYLFILEMILRLRQCCNHWKLCERSLENIETVLAKTPPSQLTPEKIKALQEALQLRIESQEECPVCLDQLRDAVITPCAHTFDRNCIVPVIEGQHKCPMCREELRTEADIVGPAAEFGEDTAQVEVDGMAPSTKVTSIMKILTARGQAANTKTVIFSQWTSFLDILEPHLRHYDISYVRIDGRMKSAHRDQAMTSFRDDETCSVMLASLNVCSVGLNLVAANQVIMSDSWWAPAIEDQAIDRVYRLGQKRPVTVWRIVAENTFEDRVLDIQRRKRELMSAAFSEKSAQDSRATRMADMEELLR